MVAAFGAYTHFWPKQFRSTGTIGYGRVDTTSRQPASSFLESYYFAVNLLWNPVGSLNVGAEYLFGTHGIKSGELDQFRGMETQTVLTPAQYKTGDVIYPYEKAK